MYSIAFKYELYPNHFDNLKWIMKLETTSDIKALHIKV